MGPVDLFTCLFSLSNAGFMLPVMLSLAGC